MDYKVHTGMIVAYTSFSERYLPHRFCHIKKLRKHSMILFPGEPVVAYIRSQWIKSTTFPPASWSVYKRTVRINNDVEGWHNRLNKTAGKSQLPFYVLCQTENCTVYSARTTGLCRPVSILAGTVTPMVTLQLWNYWMNAPILYHFNALLVSLINFCF